MISLNSDRIQPSTPFYIPYGFDPHKSETAGSVSARSLIVKDQSDSGDSVRVVTEACLPTHIPYIDTLRRAASFIIEEHALRDAFRDFDAQLQKVANELQAAGKLKEEEDHDLMLTPGFFVAERFYFGPEESSSGTVNTSPTFLAPPPPQKPHHGTGLPFKNRIYGVSPKMDATLSNTTPRVLLRRFLASDPCRKQLTLEHVVFIGFQLLRGLAIYHSLLGCAHGHLGPNKCFIGGMTECQWHFTLNWNASVLDADDYDPEEDWFEADCDRQYQSLQESTEFGKRNHSKKSRRGDASEEEEDAEVQAERLRLAQANDVFSCGMMLMDLLRACDGEKGFPPYARDRVSLVQNLIRFSNENYDGLPAFVENEMSKGPLRCTPPAIEFLKRAVASEQQTPSSSSEQHRLETLLPGEKFAAAREMLKQMLHFDYSKRVRALDALSSRFFTQDSNGGEWLADEAMCVTAFIESREQFKEKNKNFPFGFHTRNALLFGSRPASEERRLELERVLTQLVCERVVGDPGPLVEVDLRNV